jgi:hypothetical protein
MDLPGNDPLRAAELTERKRRFRLIGHESTSPDVVTNPDARTRTRSTLAGLCNCEDAAFGGVAK